MPWKETSAMDQRVQFMGDWLSGRYSKTDLCNLYGISRPTGDKWIKRYQQFGPDGLQELPRAAKHHPNAVPVELRERIIQYKLRHQYFGPKKVMDGLRREEPGVSWPADSTAGEILKRAGLVKAGHRRRRVPAHSSPLAHSKGPNSVWSADFKGDFILGDGRRCYPLTISDNYSRYLLQCRGLAHPTFAGVRPWFEWTFREYGLPEAIRTDNGPPFASLAVGGLSRLSVWWIRLGIRPERIKPGRPDQNGRHERMHKTLKEATVVPPAMTRQDQQRRFDTFVEEYNRERSHESLKRRTPSELFTASMKSYPAKLAEIEYEPGTTVRKVRQNGEIKWKGSLIYVSEVLAKEPLGMFQIDEFQWEIRYSFHLLGILDERTNTINPSGQWHDKGENL